MTVIACVIGIVLLAFAESTSVRYFGTYDYGRKFCQSAVLAYAANNVVSHSKRSVQTAMQISMGSIGAIVGAVSYKMLLVISLVQSLPYYSPHFPNGKPSFMRHFKPIVFILQLWPPKRLQY